MANTTTHNIPDNNHLLFWAFASSIVIGITGSIWMDNWLFVGIPLLFIAGYFLLFHYENIFYWFFLLLPFSKEINATETIGTDMPAEPLMLFLFGGAILFFCQNIKKINTGYITNPISFWLIFHLLWLFIACLFSQTPVISAKMFIAKMWYVIPFYFLPFAILKDAVDFKKLLKMMTIGLLLATIYVNIRHSMFDFSFDKINTAGWPFFRNHVTYACVIAILLPCYWTYYRWKKAENGKSWLMITIGVFLLVALYLTYTRACIIAVPIAVMGYFFVRMGILKHVLIASTIAIFSLVSYVITDGNYMKFAPNFERTISHHEFDNLVEATYKLEDISTMERVNRWVAGYFMVKRHPVVGYGPGSFYSQYQEYALSSFRTYVSDNPDKSGIHNYYLMTTVEQGLIGGAIFLFFCLFTLYYGENLYHKLPIGKARDLVMMAILMLIIIEAILIINDMLEAAKVGPFFFLANFIIAKFSTDYRQKRLSSDYINEA